MGANVGVSGARFRDGHGIGVAFVPRMAARWAWLGTRVLLGIGLLFAFAVVAPPGRLHGQDLEAALAQRLGYPVHIGDAKWSFEPFPSVELRDAVAYPNGPKALPIAIRARHIRLSRLPFLSMLERSSYREVDVSGLELRCGPLGIRDAVVKLEERRDVVRLKGRALGAQGGSIEISGALGGDDPTLDPLRIYLAQLELPILDLLHALPDPGWGEMRFSGVVTIEGDLEKQQEIDLDLEGAGLRRGRGGDWLQTAVQGRLIRRGGRFVPGHRVKIHGEVRELASNRDLRAVHGGIDLWLDLAGDADSGHVVLDADLEKLRLRMAELLEKPADTPASVHYEAHWAPGGQRSAQGVFALGKLRVRVDSVNSRSFSGWRLRSLSLPLAELREYLPAVRVLPDPPQGEVAIDVGWAPDRGAEGEILLRDVRLLVEGQSVEIPFARIDLTSARATFEVPRLVVADQSLGLDGSLEWVPSPGRTHLRIKVRGDHLDFESLMKIAAPLWARGGTSSKAPQNLSGTEMGTAIVQALRAQPRMLSRLQVEPAILEVGRLTGFGLDKADARYRLELSDRFLRLEQRDRASLDRPRRYALNLSAWVPKLTESP
jgi:hypothetical protein